MQRRRR
jgi:ketosteroid isomerase-like protein